MKHGKSVAIVGVGGIFPMSPTLDRFWETIIGNVDTSRQPPPGRWLLEADEAFDPQSGLQTKFTRRKPASLMTRSIPLQLPASISMRIS